jgi:hypothetical protein
VATPINFYEEMAREQAASAKRYRQAHGLDNSPAPFVPKPADVDVKAFHHAIKVKALWVPGNTLYSEMVAVVRSADAPGLADRVGLRDDELWKNPGDENHPSLVLGDCPMQSQSPDTYAARLFYSKDSICTYTRKFSAHREQIDVRERMRAAAEQEREEVRQREAARQARVKAEEQRIKDSLVANDPRTKVRELEQRVAEVEKREKAAAAERLKLLEERLAKLPPS